MLRGLGSHLGEALQSVDTLSEVLFGRQGAGHSLERVDRFRQFAQIIQNLGEIL